MRDQNRINRILEKIKDIWNDNPDQRFCQLLINLGIITDDFRIWIREDDKLEEILDLNKGWPAGNGKGEYGIKKH